MSDDLNNLKLENAQDVWWFLLKNGGLDIKTYDKEIGEEICNRLGLSMNDDISVELQNKNISTELLIHTFFSAIHPFSKMLTDLLKLFESKSIKETNDRMKIKFNFDDKNKETLEFSLEHFKAWEEEWRRISKELSVIEISREVLFTLFNAIGELIDSNNPLVNFKEEVRKCFSAEIINWLEGYKLRWPNNNMPQLSCTGESDLDELLLKIKFIWNETIQLMASLGIEHSEISAFLRRESQINNKIEELLMMETDFFAGYFLERYCMLVYQIKSAKENEKKQRVANAISKLKSCIEILPQNKIRIDEMQKKLIAFLNLPIWKKRHEVYAVWVLTQINDALGKDELEFHAINETLEFSFAGSHLATTKSYMPPIHVWSEYRSSLSNPVGKGRKKAIQPDYSLMKPPITNVSSTVVVVECKQYKKFVKGNFKNALIDYARGRPEAKVILVNYGPVNEKVLEEIDKIDSTFKDRIFMIGRLYPGQAESIEEFKNCVKGATEQYKQKKDESYDYEYYPKLNELRDIQLTWSEFPKDLDIYLFIKNSKEKYQFCYSNKGSLEDNPWIELKEDIQNGYGPENIHVKKVIKGEYLVAVNNFSSEIPLSESKAALDVVIGELNLKIDCPETGDGKWWIALKCNPSKGQYRVCNIIQDLPPSI
ncbi:hypothetical protein COL36_10770 [Bacillus wiedmannii]|uniref:hypothetical protein n=1 Tax=Bacillus wiedmannii TaxID=1890302 RepID=UPI000BF6CB0B|nr:hypothetical protein [Bacillus wiedmannii]PFX61669.1 hypothetical protein COL36_10770 [Bacillus wiedmannii]